MTLQLVSAYGLDAALGHGALVKGVFTPTGDINDFPLRLVQWQLLHQWTKKDGGVSLQDSAGDIYSLVNSLIQACPSNAIPVGVDYALTSVFTKQRGHQERMTSFFLGYCVRAMHTWGHPVVLLDPAQVRATFGLGRSADKELVWRWLNWENSPSPELPSDKQDPQGDIRDALALAYTACLFGTPQEVSDAGYLRQARLPGC